MNVHESLNQGRCPRKDSACAQKEAHTVLVSRKLESRAAQTTGSTHRVAEHAMSQHRSQHASRTVTPTLPSRRPEGSQGDTVERQTLEGVARLGSSWRAAPHHAALQLGDEEEEARWASAAKRLGCTCRASTRFGGRCCRGSEFRRRTSGGWNMARGCGIRKNRVAATVNNERIVFVLSGNW